MILLPRRKLLSGAVALALLPRLGRAQDTVVRHKAVVVVTHGTDTYTASTTWVAPAGVTSVDVECWGGGAGGGGSGSGAPASGGGGGAYSKKLAISVTAGNSYTVTVGAGGAGGTAGTDGVDGGDTWFSTSGTVLAKGGAKGRISPNNGVNPAGGASASGVGDTKYSGGQGGLTSNGWDGGGGGSSAGTGAVGGAGGDATVAGSGHPGAGGTAPAGGGNGGTGGSGSPAVAGSAPGGGGGGSFWNASLGGAGAAGKVIITY